MHSTRASKMAKNLAYFVISIGLLTMATAEDVRRSVAENSLESSLTDPFDSTDLGFPTVEGIDNIPKDLLLSWQFRRSIRKILAQMPYGWPEHDIPPLAPYSKDDFSLSRNHTIFSTETNFKPLRIDGLDNMEIKRLTVGIIIKRINFDFNFPNITFTGNFDTSTAIDLLDLMNVSVSARGSGKLDLSLENLRIAGSVKYKLPIFFGSAKISNAQTEVSLGNVRSELSGLINGVPIGAPQNELISKAILKYLNEHNFIWNGLIERYMLPVINLGLEDKTLWKIILWSMTHSEITNLEKLQDVNNADILELHHMLLRKKAALAS